MSLFGTMKTAVSGMNAQANRLGTVGDNIANSSTTGYKGASTSFSSLVLPSTSGNYNSGGVATKTNYSISEQGALTYTTSDTNLAIQGDGFFVVQSASGATFLTRAGDFAIDDEGNLVNSAGFTLLGNAYQSGERPTVVVNSLTGLVPVNINSQTLSSSPSTYGSISANLPSNALEVGGVLLNTAPSENTPYSAYNYKMTTVDETGSTDIYYTKLSENSWEVTAYVNYSSASSGFPYDLTGGNAVMASTILTFDPSTGEIIDGDPILYPDPSDPYFLDFSDLSQQTTGSSSELTVDFTINLPSDVPVATPSTPSASQNEVGSVYTTMQTVSGLPNFPAGTSLDIYYTKTAADTWEVAVFNAADATAGNFPYGVSGSSPLATFDLVFDPTTGALIGTGDLDIELPSGETATLDFTNSVSIPDYSAGWQDGISVNFNLPANAAAIEPNLANQTPADNSSASTFTNKTSLTVFDNLGGTVLIDI